MKLTEQRLLAMTMSAALTGAVAACIVLLFRWFIEAGQAVILPGHIIGNYEALPPLVRFLLPLAGGVLLGLIFNRLLPESRQVGIVHVLLRLGDSENPRLPWKNAINQFIFGSAAIISGQSVDREGPSVHLGATIGSWVGGSQNLTVEHRYTLIACGAAASIAAAFNTPLAGAVFVLEVLRVRYHVSRFMPIILAAVIGGVISRGIYGPSPAFELPYSGMDSLGELPLIVLLGIIIGFLAALFTLLTRRVAERTIEWSPLRAFTIAGLLTGFLGIWTPQILGISYDTLDAMFHNRLEMSVLWGIVVFKLIATAVSVGLRMPAGLIAPTLVIGGATASILSLMTSGLLNLPTSPTPFYAIVGMLTMMGAVLQAPMAALIALLELTGNPAILLPGMLAIVSADLINRILFNRESVFLALQVNARQKTKPAS